MSAVMHRSKKLREVTFLTSRKIMVMLIIFFGLIGSFGVFDYGNDNNVYAESFTASVTINPSLTLTIPTSTITSTLNPSTNTYSEQDLTISIGTNNTYGYKLYLSSSSTDLVNTVDSSKTIPNLTSNYSIDTFPNNYWGIRITNNSTTSSGDYGQLTQNTIISESNIPINNHTTTLGLATKIDYTNPTGTYETTLSFKALPIVTTYYMQDFYNNTELANTICKEDPTIVTDQRDEKLYTIRRINGTCWMVDNLDLAGGTKLTSELSNVTTTYTLPESSVAGWTSDSGQYLYNSNSVTCGDNSPCYSYYSFITANAGNNPSGAGNPDQDICPAGWRLPTYDEYSILTTEYNTGEKLVGSPFTVVYGGNYIENEFKYGGKDGYYWSSSGVNSSRARSMCFDTISSGICSHYKRYGFAVRCIIKTK